MDGETSGFLGTVGSELCGFPLGAGMLTTTFNERKKNNVTIIFYLNILCQNQNSHRPKLPGAIEERGLSGALLSLGGLDPGSGGALVGASSGEFLPGDETGAALHKKEYSSKTEIKSCQ